MAFREVRITNPMERAAFVLRARQTSEHWLTATILAIGAPVVAIGTVVASGTDRTIVGELALGLCGLLALGVLGYRISALARSSVLLASERNRAQRFEALGQKLEAVHEISLQLNRLVDIQTIGSLIVEHARRAVHYDNCRVHLLEGDILVPVAFGGRAAEYSAETYEALHMHVSEGITGWVASTARPEIIPDANAHPRSVTIAGTEDIDESMIVVPMMHEGQVLGVIALSKLGLNQFDSADLKVAMILAGQAATAIVNARLHADAENRAATDNLTGLWNHRYLHERLDEEITRARRYGHELSVIMVDVDNFKLYNDTYGHQCGDSVLRTVAELVRSSCRQSDIACRYGGDEFLILLPETAAGAAETVADRLLVRARAAHIEPAPGQVIPLCLSAGIATFPENAMSAAELAAAADHRLYDAKRAGGNRATGNSASLNRMREEDLEGIGLLKVLVGAVDEKDSYTADHSAKVADYAVLLGRELQLPERTIEILRLAGLVHDVGKVAIPDHVLRKPGNLNAEEWELIKRHVDISAQLIRVMPGCDEDLLAAVAEHHERWDGAGYPRQLHGDELTLVGRIMSIADAMSAMTVDRPYRRGLPLREVLDELRAGAGTQFDPELVAAFVCAFEHSMVDDVSA